MTNIELEIDPLELEKIVDRIPPHTPKLSSTYSLGTNFAANLYSTGRTQCNCVYIGKDGNNYQFYIQF